MANTLIAKRSSVAGKVPLATDLQVGEIAVNLADRLIFTKNSGGSVIQIGGSTSGSNPVVIDLTGTGSQTAFALGATPPSANAVSVYIGGAYQFKNTYTITGSTITFSEAPPNGVPIEVVWGSTLDINVPTDGVVTQAKLAPGVAGNGPVFCAYANVQQTGIASGTFTLISLNAEEFDSNSCFNNTNATVGGIPPFAFKPNVAGWYQLTGVFWPQSPSGTTTMVGAFANIYKNGSWYKDGTFGLVSTAYPQNELGTMVSALVYLNGTTDYVQMYVWGWTTSGNFNSYPSYMLQRVRFEGYLARSAT